MTTSAAASFFAAVAEQGHHVRLEKADGVILFLLAHGNRSEPWTVTLWRGDVVVARGRPAEEPTCVVRAPRELFERIAHGHTNATAALLRGEVVVEGDLRLMLLFSRVFQRSPMPGMPVEPEARSALTSA